MAYKGVSPTEHLEDNRDPQIANTFTSPDDNVINQRESIASQIRNTMKRPAKHVNNLSAKKVFLIDCDMLATYEKLHENKAIHEEDTFTANDINQKETYSAITEYVHLFCVDQEPLFRCTESYINKLIERNTVRLRRLPQINMPQSLKGCSEAQHAEGSTTPSVGCLTKLVDVDSSKKMALQKLIISTSDLELSHIDSRLHVQHIESKNTAILERESMLVVSIKRLENEGLFYAYDTERRKMREKSYRNMQIQKDILTNRYLVDCMKNDLNYDINEHYLFCCDDMNNIDAIYVNGLTPKVVNCMQRKALYFVESSFLSQESIGNTFKIKKPCCLSCTGHFCFCSGKNPHDSVIFDVREKFRLFAIFDSNRCYPEYFIKYKILKHINEVVVESEIHTLLLVRVILGESLLVAAVEKEKSSKKLTSTPSSNVRQKTVIIFKEDVLSCTSTDVKENNQNEEGNTKTLNEQAGVEPGIMLRKLNETLVEYWRIIVHFTGIGMEIRSYFEPIVEGQASTWFRLIEQSNAIKYLNSYSQPALKNDFENNAQLENVEDISICILLLSVYNNTMIEILQRENIATREDYINENQVLHTALTVSELCSKLIVNPFELFSSENLTQQDLDDLKNMINLLSIGIKEKSQLYSAFENQLSVFDIDLIAAVLGLKGEIIADWKSLDSESWYHQNEEYFVLNFLENMQNYLTEDSASETHNMFHKMGFTKERSIFILKSVTDEFLACQTPLYWASKYVEDMFLFHPLFNVRNGFHYTQNNQGEQVKENEWFKVNITRGNSTRPIHVINLSSFSKFDSETIVDRFIRKNHSEQHSFLYHGTNHTHAVSITNNRIFITKGCKNQDFSDGDGFYLAEEFIFSKQSAFRKEKPAVIVFKVPKTLLDAESNNGLDLYRKPREWNEIIKYYRSGRMEDLKPSLPVIGLNFIRGEMCCNPFKDEEPKRFDGEPRFQLCVKNDDYAERLGHIENILCVIFYKSRYVSQTP